MTTKQTLGLVGSMALACVVSLGCTVNYEDSDAGTGGSGSGKGSRYSVAGGSGAGEAGKTDEAGEAGDDTGAGGETGEFMQQCAALCDKLGTHDCPEPPNVPQCKTSCARADNAIKTNTDCTAAWAELFACRNTQPISCDADGAPVAGGCEAELERVLNCIDKFLADVRCDAACSNLVPSRPCGAKDFATTQQCKENCIYTSRLVIVSTLCWDQYKDTVECEANHSGMCLDDGEGGRIYTVPACFPKYQEVNDCVSGD